MAITYFWRAEGTTLDGTDDYTAGTSTVSLQSTATINSDNVRVGSNSLDGVNINGYATVALSASDIIKSVGCVGFWLYNESNWQTGATWRAYDVSDSGSYIQIMTADTSGAGNMTIRVRNAGYSQTNVTTTSGSLANGNWYFIVGRWDDANTSLKIEVYGTSDLSTPILSQENTSVNTNNFPPVWADLDLMELLTLGGSTQQMDNLMIADTYDAPLQDYALYTSYTQFGGASGSPSHLTLLGVG